MERIKRNKRCKHQLRMRQVHQAKAGVRVANLCRKCSIKFKPNIDRDLGGSRFLLRLQTNLSFTLIILINLKSLRSPKSSELYPQMIRIKTPKSSRRNLMVTQRRSWRRLSRRKISQDWQNSKKQWTLLRSQRSKLNFLMKRQQRKCLRSKSRKSCKIYNLI